MSTNLVPLSDLSFPDLINFDRNSMIDEIIERIKSNPDWNSLWDGELYQNSSFMILNFFSYLFEKNAELHNRLIRENFITDSVNERSIVDHLFRINVELQQNRSAVVTINASVTNNFLREDLYINAGFKIPALDLNGNNTYFEVYNLDNNGKIDYTAPIQIIANPNTRSGFLLTAYSGETFTKTIELSASDRENFFIDIADTDLIQDSIRIYYQKNEFDETELLETDTFVISPNITNPIAFPDGTPHYNIRYYNDGSARILFGSETFGGAFPVTSGKTLTIYGRKGGGKKDNIVPNAISYSASFATSQNPVEVNFYNVQSGAGGSDRENLTTAKFFGPLRANRKKTIVQDTDAINELNQFTIKHKVESPKPFFLNNKSHMMHSFHYIAPERDMSLFSIPEPQTNDTLESYKTRFETALNSFLNLAGIHDNKILDEYVSSFIGNYNTNYSFSSPIALSNPLNGTLTVKAYNYKGEEIDSLSFVNNYSGATNLAETTFDSTRVTGTIGNILNTTPQTTLVIGFDDQILINVSGFSNESYTGNAPQELVNDLNNLIANQLNISVPNYKALYPDHQWVQLIDNQLTFVSPRTGYDSKIVIGKHNIASNDLAIKLGITAGTFRPSPRSGMVFLPSTNYNHTDGVVDFVFREETNEDDYFTKKEFSDSTIWTQDPTSQYGNLGKIVLTETERVNDLVQVQDGSIITVEALDSSNVVIGRVNYTSVSDNAQSNLGSYDGTVLNNIFQNNLEHNYNSLTAELSLRMKSPVLTVYPAVPIVSDDLSGGIWNLGYIQLTPTNQLEAIAANTITTTLTNTIVKSGTIVIKDGATTLGQDDGNGNIISTAVAITGETLGVTNGGGTQVIGTLDNNFAKPNTAICISYDNGSGYQSACFTPNPTTGAFNINVTEPGPIARNISGTIDYNTNDIEINFSGAILGGSTVYIDYQYNPITSGTISYTTGIITVNFNNILATNLTFEYTYKQLNPSYASINFSIDTVLYSYVVAQSDLFNKIDEMLIEGVDTLNDELPSISGNNLDTYIPTSRAEAWIYAANHHILGLADATPQPNGILTVALDNLNQPLNKVQFNSLETSVAANSIIQITTNPKLFSVIPSVSSGTEATPYVQSFTSPAKIVVKFYRKNYSFITATYQPNPYLPEGEAAEFRNRLMAKDKRMIGHEHLLRSIIFKPVKVKVVGKAVKGKSIQEVKNNTENLIYTYFGYSNRLTQNEVGTGFNKDFLFSILNDSVNINKGISTISIIEPTNNIEDTSSDLNAYYFVLDKDIISNLFALEELYPNISGIGSEYLPEVTIS